MDTIENSLNIKVSTASLLKYALPTIHSNIFMNIYSIVDQLFVSNLLGTDALSAVSIAGPFLAIALAVGTMIATGGCALVSNQMGEGNDQAARQNFAFFMLFGVAVSTLFCIAGILFREPILHAMGADTTLYSLCEAYAVPVFLLIPFAMASIVLQIFFVAAGKPGLGFGLSIAGGVTNIILDYVLLAVIPLGVSGAAYATAAGYILQAIIGTIFFFCNRKGTLYFVCPKFDRRALLKACSNGMSEMVGMLAVTIIFAAAFLLMGFNLFESGFFTALNDGKISAILALFRTLVFLILPLLILPKILGVDGVWISMPVAEVLSIFLAVFYFQRMKSKYHYA